MADELVMIPTKDFAGLAGGNMAYVRPSMVGTITVNRDGETVVALTHGLFIFSTEEPALVAARLGGMASNKEAESDA